MKLLTGKNISLRTPFRGYIATPDTSLLIKTFASSILIMALSIFFASIFMIPRVAELSRQTSFSPSEWVILLMAISAVIILVLFSTMHFFRSMAQYRTAHSLDRAGVIIYGSIVDKWMDEVNGAPVHYVRYKYTVHVNTKQKIDKETFERLNRKGTACILRLEDLPHISRLELE